MNLIELILLAFALGIDCLIVSFSQGLCFDKNKRRNAFLLAVTMGVFQGIMPVVSYFLTSSVIEYLESFSSIIVFIIFAALGVKFIIEANDNKIDNNLCDLSVRELILLGVATSIDALGAGVNLKFMGAHIVEAAIIIGMTSFVTSVAGFSAGCVFRSIPAKYLSYAGGLILIGLGLKALI